MIGEGYLIPANTKSGQLIFGRFTVPDLILFGSGIAITMILLISIGVQGTANALVTLAPALICSFLVLPIPNYRNVKTFIKSTYQFYTSQRVYRWRGWCLYGQSEK